ncbi:hypothetical protein DFH07DRAFT_796990, partial [Mycena maculata]
LSIPFADLINMHFIFTSPSASSRSSLMRKYMSSTLLDKEEKGLSIEEFLTPDFKPNPSMALTWQFTVEKERTHEASIRTRNTSSSDRLLHPSRPGCALLDYYEHNHNLASVPSGHVQNAHVLRARTSPCNTVLFGTLTKYCLDTLSMCLKHPAAAERERIRATPFLLGYGLDLVPLQNIPVIPPRHV